MATWWGTEDANGPRISCRCAQSPERYLSCRDSFDLGVTMALLTEGDQQARRKHRSSTGKGPEQVIVIMGRRQIGDGLVEVFDRLKGCLKLANQSLAEQGMRFDDCRIGGQGHRGANAGNTLFDQVLTAHMMGVEEPYEGISAGALDGCQGGPLPEEITATSAGSGLALPHSQTPSSRAG